MNKEELIQLLKDDFDYPKEGAALISEKILQFTPELFHLFIAFIEKDEIPRISVEGYGFDTLINKFKMTPIAGFLTLDWLMREPEKAKLGLIQGYDTIKKNKGE